MQVEDQDMAYIRVIVGHIGPYEVISGPDHHNPTDPGATCAVVVLLKGPIQGIYRYYRVLVVRGC